MAGTLIRPNEDEEWSKFLFDSKLHAKTWYKEYGRRRGFDTIRHYRNTSGRMSDDSGNIFYIEYTCKRAGYKREAP